MAEKLNAGDAFPEITLNLLGGGSMTLPTDFDANYNIVLFYRGHW